MTWVVDASVAAKWLFEEESSPAARELLAAGGDLVAPELILLEVGSVAWKRHVRREVTADHARAVAAALPQLLSLLVPLSELHQRAVELALELSHPVYDCCYLALAEARGLPFVTADRRLLEKVAAAGWTGRAVHVEAALQERTT